MATLIFDYDGTLHDCIKIYAPAFRLAYSQLVSSGLMPKKIWRDDEISTWLGYTSKTMWDSFAPHLNQQKDTYSKIIGDKMLDLIGRGKAQLYDKVPQMLNTLKEKGHTLIFLSNCTERYMEAHIRKFELYKYFTEFYCAESFLWKPKHEIYLEIREESWDNTIVIGDRFQDMEVAKVHKLKSIGCGYGYSLPKELDCATRIVSKPSQIVSAVAQLV